MARRAGVVIVLLVVARLFSAHVSSAETVVPRQPLSTLPLTIGQWQGHEAPPLADDVLAQLGVDDYINREYITASSVPVGVYIGYYASQRQGDTIHSPQNCLPGAGWRPVESGVATLETEGRAIRVNQFVIQKGLDRQLVYYWYQGRGRVVANEYRNKALLMFDAARLHRTNGGLVRLITPIGTSADTAKTALSSFAVLLFPHLDRHLP
jgi:EpsI family protein